MFLFLEDEISLILYLNCFFIILYNSEAFEIEPVHLLLLFEFVLEKVINEWREEKVSSKLE